MGFIGWNVTDEFTLNRDFGIKGYEYAASVVIDGKEVGQYRTTPDPRVRNVDDGEVASYDAIVFSPDGKRYAYVGSTGSSRRVVTDQDQGKGWPMAFGAVFSPDSKHIVYLAMKIGTIERRYGAGKFATKTTVPYARSWLIVDHEVVAEFWMPHNHSTPTFDARDSCHLLVEKDNKVYRLEVKLP